MSASGAGRSDAVAADPRDHWASLDTAARSAAYDNNAAAADSAEWIERRNRDSAAYRVANQTMAALAAAIVPPTGRVKVLEVGAGTGGTTGAVLAGLDARRTDYWFTDVSPTLVAQARGKFAA